MVTTKCTTHLYAVDEGSSASVAVDHSEFSVIAGTVAASSNNVADNFNSAIRTSSPGNSILSDQIIPSSTNMKSSTDPDPAEDRPRIRWLLFVCLALLAFAVGSIIVGVPLGVILHREKSRSSSSSDKISSSQPTLSPTIQQYPSNITVGAFYYPWYSNNRFEAYLRNELDPPQLPQLGEYDQRNSDVISQHLDWSRQANVGVWLTSWRGQNSVEDSIIRDNILTNHKLHNHKIAILYETMHLVPQSSLDGVLDDIHYIAETYFGHANYYRIDDKPVIFVYLARVLYRNRTLRDFIYLLRSGASQMGYDDIYIIGDVVFGDPPIISAASNNTNNSEWYEPFFLLDAVGTYDVYGSIGATGYANQTTVDDFAQRQRAWRKAARRQGCAFIPSVSPGFNDRAVRSGHDPVSRQLGEGAEEGSLFRALLKMSLNLVEPNRNLTGSLLLVTSWNEWHEDSQIEPVAPTNTSTVLPTNLTGGLRYSAYGEVYLEILREVTITG